MAEVTPEEMDAQFMLNADDEARAAFYYARATRALLSTRAPTSGYCGDVCAGFSCEYYSHETCAMVADEYGCDCAGCQCGDAIGGGTWNAANGTNGTEIAPAPGGAPACADDPDWFKTDHDQDCGWVAKKPGARCAKMGYYGAPARDACCAACAGVAADSGEEPPGGGDFCDALCEGLTCAAYSKQTCAIVEQDYGCACRGCDCAAWEIVDVRNTSAPTAAPAPRPTMAPSDAPYCNDGDFLNNKEVQKRKYCDGFSKQGACCEKYARLGWCAGQFGSFGDLEGYCEKTCGFCEDKPNFGELPDDDVGDDIEFDEDSIVAKLALVRATQGCFNCTST